MNDVPLKLSRRRPARARTASTLPGFAGGKLEPGLHSLEWSSRREPAGSISVVTQGNGLRLLYWFDAQHTARYLAGYEWRFNRHFHLGKIVDRIAALTAPRPTDRLRRFDPMWRSKCVRHAAQVFSPATTRIRLLIGRAGNIRRAWEPPSGRPRPGRALTQICPPCISTTDAASRNAWRYGNEQPPSRCKIWCVVGRGVSAGELRPEVTRPSVLPIYAHPKPPNAACAARA